MLPLDDWRDRLALAIAYRMHAMTGVPVDTAEGQVRDFMKYGPASQNSSAVWAAGIELFGTALQVIAPSIQLAMRVIHETVEREVSNGEAVKLVGEGAMPTTPDPA